MGSGGGSVLSTLYNDSTYKRNKDLAYGIIGQYVGNAINEKFNVAAENRAAKRAIQFWNMQNEYDRNSINRAMESARSAGINPISVLGESSAFQAGAIPNPTNPSYNGAIPMQPTNLDPSAFSDLGIKSAQIRLLNAEAEKKEMDNFHAKSYDDELSSLYNDVFAKNDADGQVFYYVNKGSFDAKIDFALRNNDVSQSESKTVESEWNKFYYRHLIDDKDAMTMFVDKFKDQCKIVANQLKLSDTEVESAGVNLEMLKSAKIKLEHSDVSAFIHKENKTVDDYVEFLANLFMNVVFNNLIPANAGGSKGGTTKNVGK